MFAALRVFGMTALHCTLYLQPQYLVMIIEAHKDSLTSSSLTGHVSHVYKISMKMTVYTVKTTNTDIKLLST